MNSREKINKKRSKSIFSFERGILYVDVCVIKRVSFLQRMDGSFNSINSIVDPLN